MKGQCLYNLNEPNSALEHLLKCDEIDSKQYHANYSFLMLRGDCQFVTGKYAAALQNFKKVCTEPHWFISYMHCYRQAFELVPPQVAQRQPQHQSVVDLRILL